MDAKDELWAQFKIQAHCLSSKFGKYEVKFVIHLILPSIFFLLFVDGFAKLEGEGWSKGF